MRPTESGEQAESNAEATEERRRAKQAVPETVAEQRVPDPPGLSAWEDPPTGVLARLLARISQDGAEAYAAVEELRRFVSAQIRREIRVLTEIIEARFSVQDTKIEHHTAMINRNTAMIERNTAMIDRNSEEIKALTTVVHELAVVVAAQNAKIDSLRWMLGIVILLLMALAAMGMSNYLFPQSPVTSPNTVSESLPPAPVAAPAAPQGGAAGSVPTGPAAGTAETLRPESAPAHRTEP